MKKYVKILEARNWDKDYNRCNMNTNDVYEVARKYMSTYVDEIKYVLLNPQPDGTVREAYFYESEIKEILKEENPEYFL